jgi:GGDEF domain-containing protein
VDTAEIIVWTLMTGGLLSLALMAVADAAMTRSLGAMRNLLLLTAICITCVLLSGLPEALFPKLPTLPVMVLKAGIGPLSAALGLRLLGFWLGDVREDPLLYFITVWGSFLLMMLALTLMLLASLVLPANYPRLLLATAFLNAVPVLLTLLIGVRASLLGDPLARWLVLAGLVLGITVAGLYLRTLNVPGIGLGTWMLTAFSAVVFTLISMTLIIVRNRATRQLARLSRLETGHDPVTGLRTGAKLVTQVEHAFWRTSRMRGKCIVVCVYLSNLYDMGDSFGRAIDNQILAATAARIRRAVGFRCVMGLYHPRCFIIVFSAEKKRSFDSTVINRIQNLLVQPLQVVGSHERQQRFIPQVGISAMTVMPDTAQPQQVLNEAEHQAMSQVRRQPQAEDRVDTSW